MYRHRCIQSEKHNSRDTHAARFKFLAASVVLSVRRHRLPVVQRDRTSLGKTVDDTRSRLSSLPKLVAGRDNRAYNVSLTTFLLFFFFLIAFSVRSRQRLSRGGRRREVDERRGKRNRFPPARFRNIFAKLDFLGFLMFHVPVFTSSIVQQLQMCFFIGWREGGIKIPNL